MHIAVLDRRYCQPKRCAEECIKYCPRVRTGDETIVIGEDGRPVISEEMCIGCGICVKKCPFKAIYVVGLPEELEGREVYRYGENAFALYGLPIPRMGHVTSILGPNGTGKSTAVNILSGSLKPNLGRYRQGEEPSWEDIIKHYAGSELQDYIRSIVDKEKCVSVKPQYVDAIPEVFTGKAIELLKQNDERNALDELVERLNISGAVNQDIGTLSGGELQRVALAACMARDADFYFFDEITPYLDIYQRINVANMIRELAQSKTVLVVEHDLAILDLLADSVHIAYGEPCVFGVMAYPKGVRVGINEYLSGFLSEENIRTRREAVQFELRAPKVTEENVEPVSEYSAFEVEFEQFKLHVDRGVIPRNSVIGIVGPNGIGKTTYIRTLAGLQEPTKGKLEMNIAVSYKPQYIKADSGITVRELLTSVTKDLYKAYYATEVLRPLQLEKLLDRDLVELSGGEIQRVAIAECISRRADLYLLDEPSAHLDVEQRIQVTKVLRRFAKNNETSVMVIDHDIYLVDMLSDRLMVFSGTPMMNGKVMGPFDMREGMNRFLKNLNITFRRGEGNRPRINKPESKLDREQKEIGEYYYIRGES